MYFTLIYSMLVFLQENNIINDADINKYIACFLI